MNKKVLVAMIVIGLLFFLFTVGSIIKGFLS
jgi:hypothetical protein